MKSRARLIIPFWGDRYVSKVLSLTLPAILAPDNLPALCEAFEVDLVIVTESRLFETVRSSSSFQAAASICAVQFVSLDDLLTDVFGDYGMVLTYALFRGFADLGARVTETYLTFLQADFIISNGSLRHLAKVMREGHRVIHAPSFRVVLEDIWPRLEAKVDAVSCALPLPPRELARLALAHKHPTVKARTINQRLCHLSWMDQYYWYVDDDTMIGYQLPAALIAVKPERVVVEPTGFWDYGFLPEAAPTASPVFITDSDDFFMVEAQARDTGREMIRIGWFSLNEMANKESLRSTQQHRESGRQLLKIHAADLPADIDRAVAESRVYMKGLYRHLAPVAAPHGGDHPLLGRWFEEARERRRGMQERCEPPLDVAPTGQLSARAVSRGANAKGISGLVRMIYRKTFGAPPEVGKLHPLWADMAPICRQLTELCANGQRVLWIASDDAIVLPSLGDRKTPATILMSSQRSAPTEEPLYDSCICQMSVEEFVDLDPLYANIRPLIKNGGRVAIHVFKTDKFFDSHALILARMKYPAVDISEIHFFGTTATAFLRLLHLRASQSFHRFPIIRGLVLFATLAVIAPAVRVANAYTARRETAIFPPVWTSLLAEFTVRRRPSPAISKPLERDVAGLSAQ